MPILRRSILLPALATIASLAHGQESPTVDISDRRELFVDYSLIDKLDDVQLQLHRPVDRGPVLAFDRPWEGAFAAYVTVIHAGDKYQAYYRGSIGDAADDANANYAVCYAESRDGIHWTKPELDRFPLDGHKTNNIVLANISFDAHNFSPFIDAKPGVNPAERYKAVGGYHHSGLNAYVSPDGIHWTKLGDRPVLTRQDVGHVEGSKSIVFDSQNVPFWSAAESKYLLYYRVYKDGKRRIARVESADFTSWSNPTLMEYRRAPGEGEAPIEQLYTNQTHPYFRAPHLYVATAARFMLGRRVLTPRQADAIEVNPKYFNDVSDAVLMTSRGGGLYDRTFMEAFVSPGIGYENWTSRTNYPALNVVPTGDGEMSVYVNQNYGQPTAHLRRYSLRLDGFASVHADYDGGELITKPLTFAGSQLLLNYATSAAGGVCVEIQDAQGKPVPGFALDDCRELIGNELDRAVQWKGGDLGQLAGKRVRLRFALKDADLFAMRFSQSERE
jgi:hypothetical protein